MRTLILALLVACGSPSAPSPEPTQAPAAPPSVPSPATADAAATASASLEPDGGVLTGAVAEAIPAGGYTYLRIEADGKEAWAAVPAAEVAVGEQVSVSARMPMTSFRSETLGRVFERIYFAPGLIGPGAEVGSAPSGPAAAPAAPTTTEAPAGATHSVHQVISQRATLSGEEVTLTGKVVKFTGGVLGKNWLHLQDGTGAAGTDDLTITTDAAVAVGDQVEVKGIVVVDQDFGQGYVYPVMVTEARVRAI